MPHNLSLDAAITDLYSNPPSEFVERRKNLASQAKSDGDAALARTITALRRPTAAAHIINTLPDAALRHVGEIGAALRSAQTRLDTGAMKTLAAERQSLLTEIVDGLDVSAAVRDEVRATLLAATADPAAQAAVESRALVKAIHYSGWGEVDLGQVLAHRDAGARPALRVVEADAPAPDYDAVARAERARQERVRALEQKCDAAASAVATAEHRLEAAEAAYAAARAARLAARDGLEQARDAQADAENELARFTGRPSVKG